MGKKVSDAVRIGQIRWRRRYKTTRNVLASQPLCAVAVGNVGIGRAKPKERKREREGKRKYEEASMHRVHSRHRFNIRIIVKHVGETEL